MVLLLPLLCRVAVLINAAASPLITLMKQAFDGWWYDPGNACGNRCLVYSLGAPFGAGPAAAPGTRVGPGDGKRWLWVFFYRNLLSSSRADTACTDADVAPGSRCHT
jgi:hypothetical protein